MFHALLCSLLLPTLAAAPSEPLLVELGAVNQSRGLTIPSGGDGANVVETLGGSACRRVAGDRVHYLYVKADERRIVPGSYDAYVTVEYFDDQPRVVQVEYDKAPVDRAKNSFYTRADDLLLAGGGGQWQRAILRLPDARFGHGQNGGADFRLVGAGLAVRKIEVTFARPASYQPGGIDPSVLKQFRAAVGQGMELDMGCDASPGEAALFRALGFTCVESYVTWQSVEDAGEGQWDWSRWDRQVEVLQAAGLKWAPLLVAGPAYAMPKWFRESKRYSGYVCLEHQQESKIASLWDPRLRPWIDRFMKAFADRYRARGVLELVRLGSTGTYGETLYPSGPEDGWTYLIPGPHHNHRGWWAGDRYAVESFRQYLQQRYRDVAALNRAWSSDYATFDAVMPMLPDRAPSRRARLDMVNWYVGSMTEFGAFWAATARKYFPKTPIYQSLGGVGEVVHGADFSAQARALTPYAARVRVTNEGSDYAHNFAMTREVVSAARAFGLEFGFEPAGKVTADGNVTRLYNATASGGIHFFTYKGNLLQDQASLAAYRNYAHYLQRRSPQVRAGLYLPKTAWALDEASVSRVLAAASALRGRLDFELLDRTTIGTPLGRGVRVLALPEAEYAEPDEIASLRRWVEAGGILVARRLPNQPLLRTPEGSDGESEALLAVPTSDAELFRPVIRGPVPGRFRLCVGGPSDSSYLEGDWHPPESGGMFPDVPGARMRWTQAKAGCYLPCDPTADATLTLVANLTANSLPGVNRVLVNGAPVGTLDRAGSRTYRFPVSKQQLAGRAAAHVALEIRTFLPQEHGSRDNRELGAAVALVEICRKGAEQEPVATTTLAWELHWNVAVRCTNRVGKGATLVVPCRGASPFNEAVVQALCHPEKLAAGAVALNAVTTADGSGLFATELRDGVLYYNATGQSRRVDEVEVPANGIGWKAKAARP